MKKTVRLNPKKNSSARRPRQNDSRTDVARMTYRTTFWKTAKGKKRSKTELVPVVADITPVPTVTGAV